MSATESGAAEAAFVQPYLQPGERVLWAGRPRPGLRLTAADFVAVPLGLLWLAAAAMLGFSGAMLPVALVGLYLAVGRLPVDARLRRRTVYAVTDARLLVVTGARLRHAVPLAHVRSVREHGTTLEFPTAGLAMPHWLKLQGWPTSRGFALAFERLSDVQGAKAALAAKGILR